MKSQNATSSWGGNRRLPYAFSEHGILQLANVLKSERASQVSIQIIEVFVKLRDFLLTNLNWKLELEEIKKKFKRVPEIVERNKKKAKAKKEIIENFKKLYKSLPHTEKKIP